MHSFAFLFLWASMSFGIWSTATLAADGIVIDTTTGVGVIVGAGGVIALLFKLLIKSKDRESALLLAEKDRTLLELESVKKSYQEIAAEALKSATETANFYRQKEGKPPILMTAPVISESHSPSTAQQRETAEIQTMRAAMAKVKLATGQEARPEPEKALEPAVAVTPRAPQAAQEVPSPKDMLALATELVRAKTAEPTTMIVEKMEVAELNVPEKKPENP